MRNTFLVLSMLLILSNLASAKILIKTTFYNGTKLESETYNAAKSNMKIIKKKHISCLVSYIASNRFELISSEQTILTCEKFNNNSMISSITFNCTKPKKITSNEEINNAFTDMIELNKQEFSIEVCENKACIGKFYKYTILLECK